MEVFKLHNRTEFNVTLEMLQKKYDVARENTLKGSWRGNYVYIEKTTERSENIGSRFSFLTVANGRCAIVAVRSTQSCSNHFS